MKNNYIYVPGLSESVADEVKKEKDAEAPRFITGTGAVKKEAVIHDKGVLRTRKVDDRQSIRIPVWEKYALTVKEAAEYYNIAETKLRDYLLANRDAPFVLKGGARLLACAQASIVNGIKLIGDCLVCAIVNNVAISVSGIRIFLPVKQ